MPEHGRLALQELEDLPRLVVGEEIVVEEIDVGERDPSLRHPTILVDRSFRREGICRVRQLDFAVRGASGAPPSLACHAGDTGLRPWTSRPGASARPLRASFLASDTGLPPWTSRPGASGAAAARQLRAKGYAGLRPAELRGLAPPARPLRASFAGLDTPAPPWNFAAWRLRRGRWR